MKVVLSGGGTAGHINPALSIAKKILQKEPEAQILFVGTPGGMENRLVTKEGFAIRHVEIKGFQRKLTLQNLKTAVLAFTSISKAKKILKEFRPDVVIGTGGYVSWPVLKAASSMNIPTLIHEQNALPGLTTQRLSKVVNTVCISFAESREKLPCKADKTVLCGNPTNPAMASISRGRSRSQLGVTGPYLLSFGGSLGAGVINSTVFELAKNYSSKKPVFHTHAFGQREYEMYANKEEKEGICRFGNVKFTDYIYDMPRQLAAADLVICRAGAITLAELALTGTPAILIPSPNVTDNHQYKNALVYHEKGAAVLIEEKDLTVEKLMDTVSDILTSPERLRQMSENMKALSHPDALENIWIEIQKIIKKQK